MSRRWVDAMLAEAGAGRIAPAFVPVHGPVARSGAGPANSDAAPGRPAPLREVRGGARAALEAMLARAAREAPAVPGALAPLGRAPVPEGGWTVEAWWASLDAMPRVAVVRLEPRGGTPQLASPA
ncbi:hypothetical protein BCF33_1279 [Hasllibacter halocynthiae]|uniref:Uncharacterized protein n=1 Tax=Hasllibacter halocynthiae TaxID=595589 RepID=A0A2T0X9Q6_9RHOB|nr:hypothetical protein [Hasllibacter halocynthiae]PRY95657.1 hypothetical protein BCF33_1279 [Hasllibacter halocynthiae]